MAISKTFKTNPGVDFTTLSGNSGQKRKMTSTAATGSHDVTSFPDNSVSGYSADREDSSTSPPMNSIDLDNERKYPTLREMNSNPCPKRQKKCELHFAASSIKADLARAGIEYALVDPKIENSTKGPIPINLNAVKLVSSNEFKTFPVSPTAMMMTPASVLDYRLLVSECSEMYPRKIAGSSNLITTDSVRTTSSVSESDTESVSSNKSTTCSTQPSPLAFIPPVLCKRLSQNLCRSPTLQPPCNLIPTRTASLTMSETLVLTDTPRLVALSHAPFSIVHANAAYLRLSGLPIERIIGSDFDSLFAQSNAENGDVSKPVLLSDCIGSNDGQGAKHEVHQENAIGNQPIERLVKVVPIVSKKPRDGAEVSHVTHFSVDLLVESSESSPSPEVFASKNMKMSAEGMAVGVMG